MKEVCRGAGGRAAYRKPFCTMYLIRFLLISSFVLFVSPCFAFASDTDIEENLQSDLAKSRSIVKKAKDKQKKGEPADKEISDLKKKAGEIKAAHRRLQEKFRLMEDEMKSLGQLAQERHRVMEEGYNKAMEEYFSLIDSLPPGNNRNSQDGSEAINQLEELLEKKLHKKKTSLLGVLPYRNLNYPAVQPAQGSPVVPAYKGGNKNTSPEDLKSTEEAPIWEEIASLAQSLNWNPVSIYEYVKNNIETEWYWGCLKGAEETLHQKSGNDCDQGALLVSLLRASGFPARYVRGTIEFFAGGKDIVMDKVKNLTGIDDPIKIAEFFQRSGIPYIPIIFGGKISNFQIEHIWVETLIPYGNYRGAIIDDSDKTWLGLDTSIKRKGYSYNTALDVFDNPAMATRITTIKDEYLSSLQTQTPLEYLEEKITSTGQSADVAKATRILIPDILKILPAGLQFEQRRVTNEYSEIPDELKHKVRFLAYNADSPSEPLFDIRFDTLELSNRQITLSYEPETIEDQEIIDAYGGIDNTAAYLARLRPVMKIEGEMVAAGDDGLPIGGDYSLAIELISPNGTEAIGTTQITGNVIAIGIVAGKVEGAGGSAFSDADAETILSKEAYGYLDRWSQSEDQLASLLHLTISHPIPIVTTTGGVIKVTYLLDLPHGIEWKGVFVDANERVTEAIESHHDAFAAERQKTFMQLSALQGSILENRIFEDDFRVDSISTAKLFEIANANHTPILTIDNSNISAALPLLPFDEEIKQDVENSVNQHLTVRIPQSEISYDDWTGIGYIKEEPGTDQSGWMLTGIIAGGMTALSPQKWSNQALMGKLRKPNKSYKSVSILSPLNGSSTFDSMAIVTGVVTDSSMKVVVNGMPADMNGVNFTAVVALTHGKNQITATSKTVAGIDVSDTVYVTQKTPVAMIITFPYDGAEVSSSPLFVEGLVSDPAASVSVSGITAKVSSDGKFIAEGITLTQGANQITAQCSNDDGATAAQTINVNYKSAQTTRLSLTITSPKNEDVINGPAVNVEGTVTSSASEISVKVNGVPAEVYEGKFSMNGVVLTGGQNLIVVDGLDSNGSYARAEVTIQANTDAPNITLRANVTSGIPPLSSYFSVSTATPNPIVSYQMDFERDGVVDYTGDNFDDITFTYTAEGIYHPIVTVTDDQGNTYSASIAITVLNREKVDVLLKSKWMSMTNSLAIKDTDTALTFIASGSRAPYKEMFDALYDQLPSITATQREFNLVYVTDNVAKYKLVTFENDKFYSYEVTFVKDGKGLWKILQY